tara:strand:+ start:57 stop:611 length:555 start_codon:yes stop_codon:yes gene_type:complete
MKSTIREILGRKRNAIKSIRTTELYQRIDELIADGMEKFPTKAAFTCDTAANYAATKTEHPFDSTVREKNRECYPFSQSEENMQREATHEMYDRLAEIGTQEAAEVFAAHNLLWVAEKVSKTRPAFSVDKPIATLHYQSVINIIDTAQALLKRTNIPGETSKVQREIDNFRSQYTFDNYQEAQK